MSEDEIMAVILDYLGDERDSGGAGYGYFDLDDPENATIDARLNLRTLAARIAKVTSPA